MGHEKGIDVPKRFSKKLMLRNDFQMDRSVGDGIVRRQPDAEYVTRAALAVELLFQGKWRIHILCALKDGPIRFGQLSRLVPGASKKMLTQNLRKLETDGIVVRKDLSDLVLHIE